jgi:hypothetical protein
MTELGMEVVAQSPPAAVKTEIEQWSKMIKELGLKAPD